MTAFLPLLLALFAGPVVAGCAMGAWSWWLPRRRLNVIWTAQKRARRLNGTS